jgi:quercetin dioxygenase-like cupin family protein
MMRARGHLRKALFISTSMCLVVATQAPVVVSQPANKPPPDAATDSEGKPLPGTSIPCAPVAEKRQELGCYVVARQRLGALPPGMPLSWHLNVFPDRAAAEAAKGQFGTVAEAFDRTWLFTIAPPDWRPVAGVEHVATVGPLPLEPRAAEYTAVYLATTFRPGLSSSVHKHSGPEAWFIVSGEQCLETPDGLIWGRAGEGVAVRGELPMIVQATGSEIRRSFALILHDAAKASSTPVDHWKPQGLCRN